MTGITGPSIGYVYCSPPESRVRGGCSPDELTWLAEKVQHDVPQATGMLDALERLKAAADPERAVEDLFQEGKVLLGASYRDTTAPVGLLYAEGSPSNVNVRPFIAVKLGTWVVRPGISMGDGRKLVYELSGVRNHLLVGGLSTKRMERPALNDGWWGVPVGRMTVVTHLWAQGGEPPEPYVYGHDMDRREIDKMRVPDELKKVLHTAAAAKHNAEIEAAGIVL